MATASLAPTRGIEVHNILKDGQLVAVLMAIDGGETFTVISEIHRQDASGPDAVRRTPYTFSNAGEGHAFFSEAVTAFTYLGCEVRRQ